MYTFDSRVRYSETGEEGLLSLPAIVDYFQDVSTFQSEDLGIGIDFLKEKDLLWVMSAWQVVVHRYPALGEKIKIGTIPYELRGFMGLRNFFMDTEDGERLAQANSVWSLINHKKGVPVRVLWKNTTWKNVCKWTMRRVKLQCPRAASDRSLSGWKDST